jgi:hypothetical protein
LHLNWESHSRRFKHTLGTPLQIQLFGTFTISNYSKKILLIPFQLFRESILRKSNQVGSQKI